VRLRDDLRTLWTIFPIPSIDGTLLDAASLALLGVPRRCLKTARLMKGGRFSRLLGAE
jgi:hypothetical protein